MGEKARPGSCQYLSSIAVPRPIEEGMQPLVTAADGSARTPEGLPVSQLLPVFVPAACIGTARCPGPYAVLEAHGIVLTWAVRPPGDAIRPITSAIEQAWDAQGIDWKARALRNLRELSPPPLATGALLRDDGDTWLISLKYPDGLAASRLLLHDELARLFPAGYRVALPESNRAFAFARDLDREDIDTVQNLVQRGCSSSACPLSPEIFDPEDLRPARGAWSPRVS